MGRYKTAKENNDCLWLLRTIRGIELNYEITKPKLLSLGDSLEQFIVFRQEVKSNNDNYFKVFNGLVSVYDYLGGTLMHGTGLDAEVAATIVACAVAANAYEDVAVAKKRVITTMRDKVLATVLIK